MGGAEAARPDRRLRRLLARARSRTPTKAVNFIVHKGDEKDTAEDRSFLPTEKPSVWLQSGDSTVYAHPRRRRGLRGDPLPPRRRRLRRRDLARLQRLLGPARLGRLRGDGRHRWQTPMRPIGRDGFGLVFKVRLVDGATRLAYIVHRGDTKDPGPDQFLDLDALGHEVWILSGHVDADNDTKYLLPMIGGPGIDAEPGQGEGALARRATRSSGTRSPCAGGTYHLSFSPTGGLVAGPRGSPAARRSRSPACASALRRAEGEVAAPRRLQRVPDRRRPTSARVPEALRGQLAVSASRRERLPARRDRRPDPGRPRRPLRQRRRPRRRVRRPARRRCGSGRRRRRT